MTPRSIKYWVSEISRPESMTDLPPDLQRADSYQIDASEINALDRTILGFERPADHTWWRQGGQPCYSYRRDGQLVGYAYVDDGYIGPALAVDEGTLCTLVADVIRTGEDPSSMSVNLCGDSTWLFRMLVNAGGRIDNKDKYRFVYCSSVGPLPASYIHHSDWLP